MEIDVHMFHLCTMHVHGVNGTIAISLGQLRCCDSDPVLDNQATGEHLQQVLQAGPFSPGASYPTNLPGCWYPIAL